MKKILLLFTICFISSIYAQQEFKLNITDALALKTLTVSYEYYFNEETSIGISGLFNFEDESSDFRYNENTVITPYFRHYFSTESLWNFFGELFVAYNTRDDEFTSMGELINSKYSDAALGLAVGYKYISTGGFTVDLHGGLGRNLFSDDSRTIIPRVGVNIGWQF